MAWLKRGGGRWNRSGPVSQLKRPHHHNQYVLIYFLSLTCTQQRLPTDTTSHTHTHIYTSPWAQLPTTFLFVFSSSNKKKTNRKKNSGRQQQHQKIHKYKRLWKESSLIDETADYSATNRWFMLKGINNNRNRNHCAERERRSLENKNAEREDE